MHGGWPRLSELFSDALKTIINDALDLLNSSVEVFRWLGCQRSMSEM
jgi:hypothetical protein